MRLLLEDWSEAADGGSLDSYRHILVCSCDTSGLEAALVTSSLWVQFQVLVVVYSNFHGKRARYWKDG